MSYNILFKPIQTNTRTEATKANNDYCIQDNMMFYEHSLDDCCHIRKISGLLNTHQPTIPRPPTAPIQAPLHTRAMHRSSMPVSCRLTPSPLWKRRRRTSPPSFLVNGRRPSSARTALYRILCLSYSIFSCHNLLPL